MYVKLSDKPTMKCLYFIRGRTRPFKDYMSKLKKKAHKAYKEALKYYVLHAAFEYASRCSYEQFKILLNTPTPRHSNYSSDSMIKAIHFEYLDPKTSSYKLADGWSLVQKITIDGKSKPIFELRIGNVQNTDFGLRCLFFYTKHSIDQSIKEYNCQCYTYEFPKTRDKISDKSHNGKHDLRKRSGNNVTTYFGRLTYHTYKDYRENGAKYKREFTANNVIV